MDYQGFYCLACLSGLLRNKLHAGCYVSLCFNVIYACNETVPTNLQLYFAEIIKITWTQREMLKPRFFCFQKLLSLQPESGPRGKSTLIMYKILLINFIECVTVWFLPHGSLRVSCPRPNLVPFGSSEPASFTSEVTPPPSCHCLESCQ